MAFTFNDLVDLKRLLIEHPEWRVELRELILTDELVALPRAFAEWRAEAEARFERIERALEQLTQRVDALTQRVDALAQAQIRTEERLTRLEQAVEQLTQRVDALAQAQIRTEERLTRLEQAVEQLTKAQIRTEEQLGGLAEQYKFVRDRTARLWGRMLAQRYADHADAYFGDFLRRIQVLLPGRLDPATEDALRTHLTAQERREATLTDLLLFGRLAEPPTPDPGTVWLAVEVSAVIDRSDVERAERRANLLRKAGLRTVPVVAGEEFTHGAWTFLEQVPVLLILDGRSEGWERALGAA